MGTTNRLAALLVTANLLCALPAAAQRPAAAEKPRPTEREGAARPAPKATAAPRQQPTAAAATMPVSARYRVTLNGFRVNRESWDTFLETDGKGDEVTVMAEVQVIDAKGEKLGESRRFKSLVYGDRKTFPARVMAGSRSSLGGLKTGDNAPGVPDPWVRREAPSAERLPMLLWEGELRLDESAVLIAPVVWELDSDDVLTATPANVIGELGGLAKSIAPLASFVGGSLVASVVSTSGSLATQLAHFQREAGNRPIGVTPGGAKGLAFSPKLVVLNVRTAEASLAPGANKYPGVIEVRYTDPEDLKGDYTLFLQVERLP